MKAKRITLLLAAAIATALVASGCTSDGDGGDNGSSDLRDVRIGIIPFQDFYPFLFAEDKGWFEEAGIKPTFVNFDGFSDSATALAAGEVDLAPQEVGAMVPTTSNFDDAVLTVPVHVFNNGFAIMIRPDSDMKTYDELLDELGDEEKAGRAAAKQLEGKTIVTTADSDMEIGAYSAVTLLAGLPWDSVDIVDLEANDGLAAFLSGTGDAYIGGIPQRVRALSEGYHELLTGQEMGPGSVPLVSLAASADAIADPDTYELYLDVFDVWNRTNTYAGQSEENLLEVGGFIAEKLNAATGAQLTAEGFTEIFNGWQQFPANAAEWQKWYDVFPPQQRWDTAVEFFVDIKGTVPSDPGFADHIVLDKFVADYAARS